MSLARKVSSRLPPNLELPVSRDAIFENVTDSGLNLELPVSGIWWMVLDCIMLNVMLLLDSFVCVGIVIAYRQEGRGRHY